MVDGNLRPAVICINGIVTDFGTGHVCIHITVGVDSVLQILQILQVLQTVKTDTFTTTSTSFVDVTGLSVSITPATTSSKILILVHAYGGNAGTSSANALTTLVRDSTEVFIGDAASNRIRSTTTIGPTRSATGYGYSMHINYLDSPSTTSSTTYKLQAKAADSGTFVLGRDGDDADQANEGRTPSSIIVMEVGA